MLITMNSILTGRTNTMELDVTEEQLAAWRGGIMIQDAMPHLAAAEREFLISGATQNEWDEAFGPASRKGADRDTTMCDEDADDRPP